MSLAVLFPLQPGSGPRIPTALPLPVPPAERRHPPRPAKSPGKVVDAETGKTIIGANVGVVGTSLGDATDINGKYTIAGLQPGIYALQVS
ncbi:MAG: carboxypeptidase-like regulatory domain-containing protein [Balneolaceae bacterium]|nr:carboxypeptidase-like regulatory domain-containing protein [Balneolaceae bacterium]